MNYNYMSYNLSDLSKLKTGDLILCVDRETTGLFGIFTSIIKWGTHSNFTHTGVILKDPDFIQPPLKVCMFGNQAKKKNLILKMVCIN